MLAPIMLFGIPTGLIFIGLLTYAYQDFGWKRSYTHSNFWLHVEVFAKSIGATLLVLLGVIITVLTLGIGGIIILSLLNKN
jgi:hypothetical protein